MDRPKILTAIMFISILLIAPTTQAQVNNVGPYQNTGYVISDQTSPYFPTTYSNQSNQGQTPDAGQQSTDAGASGQESSNSCQCPDCQAKKVTEAKIRSQLTGDWFGLRSGLANKGIVYEASMTNFYQGVSSGGGNQRFRYGAKIDQYFLVDSKKLGLWDGGSMVVHVDSALGQNSILDAAAFAPANTAMLTPRPSPLPVTAITNLQFNQEMGNGYVATVGKYNFLDLWAQFYPDYGKGVDGFMNISSMVFLNVVPTLPLIFDGVGVLKAGEKGVESAVMVLDPTNIPTSSGLDPLFAEGVTLLGIKRFFTDFGGLPGSHLFAATWSSKEFTSYEPAGWVTSPLLRPIVGLPSAQSNSWLAGYVLDQTLWMDPCNKKRKVWLTSTWGISDRETSPFEWMGTASIEGIGLNPMRANDRMGISYWYNRVSNPLKNLVSPLIELQDVHGGEVYYNREVTPWCHVTADLQVFQPELQFQDTAIVVGLRAKIDF